MHKSRPQLILAGPLILHNARPHIADVVTEKLRDYGWEVLPHAPYSPDMSLQISTYSRGRSFSSLEELFIDGTQAIRHISKSALGGIIMLPERWDRVFMDQGDYIEELLTYRLILNK